MEALLILRHGGVLKHAGRQQVGACSCAAVYAVQGSSSEWWFYMGSCLHGWHPACSQPQATGNGLFAIKSAVHSSAARPYLCVGAAGKVHAHAPCQAEALANVFHTVVNPRYGPGMQLHLSHHLICRVACARACSGRGAGKRVPDGDVPALRPCGRRPAAPAQHLPPRPQDLIPP